jgi:hypothetical protein
MKRTLPYLAISFCLVFSISSGCKKEEGFDSKTVQISQMTGTWRGEVTSFKNYERVEKSGDILLEENPVNGLLDGLFSMGEVHFLTGFQFVDGVFYFSLLCSDTLNPTCYNWNLSGYVFLRDEHLMEMHLAGFECGQLGKQFATYEGTLMRINPGPDPSVFYSFAAVGHQWTYINILENGDTCSVTKEIVAEPATNLFTVNETITCSGVPSTDQYNWTVERYVFSAMQGTSGAIISHTFYIDAPVENPFVFIAGNDTTILTLKVTSEAIKVPAGTFTCDRFLIDQRIHTDVPVYIYGYLWLSKPYGIIQFESLIPQDSSAVAFQKLTSRNF